MPELPSFTVPDFGKNPANFLKEVKNELNKVIWPTKNEVFKLTVIVVAISAFIGLYIGGLDLVFTKWMDFLFKR